MMLNLFQIGVVEKGWADVNLTVTGTQGHSSTPPKETSIGILANAISNLEKKLHRNHLLILDVKNKLLVLYSQLSSNSRVIMDRQIQLGLEILQVKKEYLNL